MTEPLEPETLPEQIERLTKEHSAAFTDAAMLIINRLVTEREKDKAEIERLRRILAEYEAEIEGLKIAYLHPSPPTYVHPEILKKVEEQANQLAAKDCWADSISGPNPMAGPPNTPFCHNEMRGRECGKVAREALAVLSQQDTITGSSNGRTAPFEGVNAGSSPAPVTTQQDTGSGGEQG